MKTEKNDVAIELTAEQQVLVKQHMGLAMKLGMKYRGYCTDAAYTADDLQQEACFGLCQAAARFNAGKGVSFETYAFLWCTKYIYMALFNQVEEADSLVPAYLADLEDTRDDDRELLLEKVGSMMQVLDDAEKQVVSYYYGLEMRPKTMYEIGRCMNRGTRRVEQIFERAMIKLEQSFMD